MSELCRRFGISRGVGYKWLERWKREGPAGLLDRSREPHHHPTAVTQEVVEAVLRAKVRHPSWGPKKLMPLASEPEAIQRHWPVPSTIGDILHRHGMVVPRRRRRRVPPVPVALPGGVFPNEEWCADFKGWRRTGDGQRFEPLTICDSASRMLLRCQIVAHPDTTTVQAIFDAAFREFGLPHRIRTDNGPPFVSVAVGGLSRLSVWWLQLGIMPQRIAPGHPEQNGRLERLHRTLEAATARPPARTLTAQQRRLEQFRQEYNQVRPHEALGQRPPATVYTSSPRSYPQPLRDPPIPDAARQRRVRYNGTIKWHSQEVFVTEALAGHSVGVLEADAGWGVWYGPIFLGTLDLSRNTLKRPSNRRSQRRP